MGGPRRPIHLFIAIVAATEHGRNGQEVWNGWKRKNRGKNRQMLGIENGNGNKKKSNWIAVEYH